jgi:hypothetical protein
MKKLRYFLLIIIFIILGIHFFDTFALTTRPDLTCDWLPWCSSSTTSDKPVFKFISNIIASLIKYVAAFSVIAIMIAWVYYVLSVWEDEKTKKAKKWIIWSLVWVILSISAWSIINILNTFRIN